MDVTDNKNMEEQKPTDDVIVEETAETSQTAESAEHAQAAEEQTTDSVTVEQKDEQIKDDYWKNRAFEMERKFHNLTHELPKIIEETLIKHQPQQKQEEKYTIAQLEAFAQEHPEHRPWVEEQKLKILESNISSKLEEKRIQDRNEMIRQQTFQSVLNDPRYQEAFIVDQFGRKQLNPSSPMAIAMDAYLREPDIAKRPDAWAIAAKLARADVMDAQLGNQEQKLTSLKRQNAQLKQKTLIEGSSMNNVKPVRDSFTEASMRLAQTGTRKDAQDAVREYLKKIGRIE